MRAAICYYSQHHGNTRKVAEAIAREGSVDLIDIATAGDVRLDGYDCVGFASGIYGFEVHPSVTAFARRYLPRGKAVFFLYTYGGAKGSGTKTLAQVAAEKDAPVLGEFGCPGYNTFGPFKLVGGTGKGRPNADDLARAREFYRSLAAQIS